VNLLQLLAVLEIYVLGDCREVMPILKSLSTIAACIVVVSGSISATCQILTLDDTIKAAQDNNRSIRIAQLESGKARDELRVARTYRLPVFSLSNIVLPN